MFPTKDRNGLSFFISGTRFPRPRRIERTFIELTPISLCVRDLSASATTQNGYSGIARNLAVFHQIRREWPDRSGR